MKILASQGLKVTIPLDVVPRQGQVRSEAPGGQDRGQEHGHPRPGGHDSRPGQRHLVFVYVGLLAPPAPPPAPVSTTTTTAVPTNGACAFPHRAQYARGAVALRPHVYGTDPDRLHRVVRLQRDLTRLRH